MQQITILGASGFVGSKLVEKAIDHRFKVKVLIHDMSKQNKADKLKIVEGNYFDKDKLQKSLEGSEAILSTIGPPMHAKLSSEDEDNYINSLAFIIKQMQKNKQSRWISISNAGVKMADESLPLARKLLRVSQKEASRSYLKIKDRELQLLEQSNLDWTNIRPPMIREEIEGEFVADENNFLGMTVDLNQLCDFMIAEIRNIEWHRKAPVIATKKI